MNVVAWCKHELDTLIHGWVSPVAEDLQVIAQFVPVEAVEVAVRVRLVLVKSVQSVVGGRSKGIIVSGFASMIGQELLCLNPIDSIDLPHVPLDKLGIVFQLPI